MGKRNGIYTPTFMQAILPETLYDPKLFQHSSSGRRMKTIYTLQTVPFDRKGRVYSPGAVLRFCGPGRRHPNP